MKWKNQFILYRILSVHLLMNIEYQEIVTVLIIVVQPKVNCHFILKINLKIDLKILTIIN